MVTMKRGTLEATLYAFESNIIVVSISDNDYTNGGVFLCHHGIQTSPAFNYPDSWTTQRWIWLNVKGNGRTHVEGK